MKTKQLIAILIAFSVLLSAIGSASAQTIETPHFPDYLEPFSEPNQDQDRIDWETLSRFYPPIPINEDQDIEYSDSQTNEPNLFYDMDGNLLPFGDYDQVEIENDPNAVKWYDGGILYSAVVNCVNGYMEYGVGTYVGFVADVELEQPIPGQTYEIRFVIAGLGQPCAGQIAWVDLALPPGTQPSITAETPIRCFFSGYENQPPCPTNVQPSTRVDGGWFVPSGDASTGQGFYVGQGRTVEIHIPVVSSGPLNGEPLRARIELADGNADPVLWPTQGVWVFSDNISIVYPSPSTIYTCCNDDGSLVVESTAYVKNRYTAGRLYFEIGDRPGVYNLYSAYMDISDENNSEGATEDWLPAQLLHRTTYYWRARFETLTGETITGMEQSFITPFGPEAVIGDGTPERCTEEEIREALANRTTHHISFDCGPDHFMIAIKKHLPTGVREIVIDGGHKITLKNISNQEPLLISNIIQPAEIKNIRLIDGMVNKHFASLWNTGGIVVDIGADLKLTNVIMENNRNEDRGGAIYVRRSGKLTIVNSIFRNNHSDNYGGVLYVKEGGEVTVSHSLFENNHAGIEGGAIYNEGNTSFIFSEFSSNTASTSAGAIFSRTGSNHKMGLEVTNSLLINNRTLDRSPNPANHKGGTVLNASGYFWLTSSTISQSSSKIGGALFLGAGSKTHINGVTIVGSKSFPGAAAIDAVDYQYVQISNSILADNSMNCGQTVDFYEYTGGPGQGINLSDDESCDFKTEGSLYGVDPMLGPLANNGGPTRTYALLPGSPAIDVSPQKYCGWTDQRGFYGGVVEGVRSRAADGNGDGIVLCDLGAYEVMPSGGMLYLPVTIRP